MDKQLLSYLKQHFLFEKLEEAEINTLEHLVSLEKIDGSHYIFLEDEKARHFFILKKGALQARIGSKLIATIQPGQIFGEIAVLNESYRTGSVYSLENSEIIRIDGKEILHGTSVPVEISFKILRELIKPLISLHYTNDFFKRTSDILREGESDKVEFKSTLRLNIHTGKFGREIEHAALKTIAAFLNTRGGILLVGIDDKGHATGIDQDKFENDDKALLHLTQMVNDRIGSHFMQFINCSIEPLENHKIMRVDVQPANMPAYLSNNNEEYFYIRTGPSTTDLKTSQIFEYIGNRFFRPRA